MNRTKALITDGNDLIANLTEILNNNTASPAEIKKLAEEVSSIQFMYSQNLANHLAAKCIAVTTYLMCLIFVLQTLELKLQLDPEQIKELAAKIDDTVSKLENVDTIIQNTRSDLNRVNNLKDVALDSR